MSRSIAGAAARCLVAACLFSPAVLQRGAVLSCCHRLTHVPPSWLCQLIAVYEAGRALMGYLTPNFDEIQRVRPGNNGCSFYTALVLALVVLGTGLTRCRWRGCWGEGAALHCLGEEPPSMPAPLGQLHLCAC